MYDHQLLHNIEVQKNKQYYIVLQSCGQVGGSACCCNKYVHSMDNFKFAGNVALFL
jgi:hypothetical protein